MPLRGDQEKNRNPLWQTTLMSVEVHPKLCQSLEGSEKHFGMRFRARKTRWHDLGDDLHPDLLGYCRVLHEISVSLLV